MSVPFKVDAVAFMNFIKKEQRPEDKMKKLLENPFFKLPPWQETLLKVARK